MKDPHASARSGEILCATLALAARPRSRTLARTTDGTRRRLAQWLAIGMLVAGCGDMAASPILSAPNQGGQTGSLVPPTCREEAANPLVVPQGRTAFVEGWHEYWNPVLEDADGNVVETTIVQDETNALVQTESPLASGDYTLTYSCGDAGAPIQREINVAEAAPLPAAFGELEFLPPDLPIACSKFEFMEFKWTPTPEFLPYLDLVKLSFEFAGADFGPLPQTEPLTADLNGEVTVKLPNCTLFEFPCGFTSGSYVLRASIAGQEQEWASPRVELDVDCVSPPRQNEPGASGCALGAYTRGSGGGIWWLLVLTSAIMRLAKQTKPACSGARAGSEPRETTS